MTEMDFIRFTCIKGGLLVRTTTRAHYPIDTVYLFSIYPLYTTFQEDFMKFMKKVSHQLLYFILYLLFAFLKKFK